MWITPVWIQGQRAMWTPWRVGCDIFNTLRRSKQPTLGHQMFMDPRLIEGGAVHSGYFYGNRCDEQVQWAHQFTRWQTFGSAEWWAPETHPL
jgi:hypothetical protein